MLKLLALITVFSLAFTLTSSSAGAAGATVITPSQLHWQSGNGLPPGAKMAVVSGDPNGSGWFTVRLSLPAGGAFPPHTHPTTEYVTVLSGTVEFGTGDSMSNGTPLGAGSYVVVPAGVHHHAKAQTAAIVQVSGMGPFKTTFIKQK
ncbi:MAG: cupin domain-containing protein [Candidatus Eremiobacteraeota bacterium]|nr:cupin domain-containing protein [Candidatus Eremiobacteraeota bacterium]MBV8374470.1 cupin domain-containing protein [Candidatus Eremiobacteraeota bacterium]